MSYWIAPAIGKESNKETSVINVIHYICDYYNVVYEDVKSKKRDRELVVPRQMIAYILHKIIGISSSRTGKYINRDHSTVLYSCNEIKKFLEYEYETKKSYSDIVKNNFILLTNNKATELCKN